MGKLLDILQGLHSRGEGVDSLFQCNIFVTSILS